MSRMGGLVLILGGLAVAAYAMPPDVDASGSEAASQTGVVRSARVEQRPSQDAAGAIPQPAFRSRASGPAPTAEPAFSAPVVVTVAPRPIDAATSPTRAAAFPRDRDTLTRELQKELRRVGCYEGELNGAWTPATRRAMKAYTDRLNASLPVEEPDAVLFSMVQGEQDRVCGKPCPAGQGLSEDGRCLPNAILAKATKKTSRRRRWCTCQRPPAGSRKAGARDRRMVDDHHGCRARAGAGRDACAAPGDGRRSARSRSR